MPESELYRKGVALRGQLMGEALTEQMNQSTYSDPVMQKFRDLTTETVFGALWARPGLDHKTRALICVVSDAATGTGSGAGSTPAHGAAAGLDRGGADGGAAAPAPATSVRRSSVKPC